MNCFSYLDELKGLLYSSSYGQNNNEMSKLTYLNLKINIFEYFYNVWMRSYKPFINMNRIN
jgi:hypothetical protein